MWKYASKIKFILITLLLVFVLLFLFFLSFIILEHNELYEIPIFVSIIVAILSGLIARKKGRSFVIFFSVSICLSFICLILGIFAIAMATRSVFLMILSIVLGPLPGIIPACVIRPTERILEKIRSQFYERESKRLKGKGIIGGKNKKAPVIRNTIPFTNRPLEYRHKMEFISATLAIVLASCCVYVFMKPGLRESIMEIPGLGFVIGFIFSLFLLISLEVENGLWEWIAFFGVFLLIPYMFFYSTIKIVFMCLAYKDFSKRHFRVMIVLLLSSIVIPALTVILF